MFEEDKSIIRYIIGSCRVKYTVLHDIFKPSEIQQKNYRAAMLLVDGHCIFDKLLRPDNLALYTKSLEETVIDIVVNFFNVLGHYRVYMARYFALNNDIFVTFNRTAPTYQTDLFPVYQKKMLGKYNDPGPDAMFIIEAISKAWEFICSISPYFEGIYCIDCPGVDDITALSSVGSVTHAQMRDVYKIYFTHNELANQFISESTVVFHHKRDDSYLIDLKNSYQGVLDSHVKVFADANRRLPPSLLPMVWAVGGCKSVGVGPAPFAKTTNMPCKVALEMMKPEYKYNRVYWDFGEFVRAHARYTSKVSDIETLHLMPTLWRRFKVVDLYGCMAAITPSQAAKMKAQIIDLYDENELESLNDILGRNKCDPELFDIQALNQSEGVRFDYD